MATRKSTQKYEVYHITSGTIVLSGISKTEATKIARQMGGGAARPVPDMARDLANWEI